MKLLSHFLFVVAAAALAPGGLFAQGPGAKATPLEPTIASGGEVAATTAVEVWLGMIDDGRYPESWQSAGSLFKATVPQDKWLEILKTGRQPMGKLLARTQTSRQFMRTLPGAPGGQYVVCRYNASYENKKTATETITSVLDVDGQWRVVGYFVH